MNTSILQNPFFQALHSPKGANAYFACGLSGSGAIAVETDRIPKQNLYIGISNGKQIKCFPFFSKRKIQEWAKDFMIQTVPDDTDIEAFPLNKIHRTYNIASDIFSCGTFRFSIASPTDGIADPYTAPYTQLRQDLCPALPLRIEIDNTNSQQEREVFFAIDGVKGAVDLNEVSNHELCGFINPKGYAVAAWQTDYNRTIQHNTLREIFIEKKSNFRLGEIAGISFSVPAGEKKQFDLVIGFYAPSSFTSGATEASYLYKRFFPDLLSVVCFALEHLDKVWQKTEKLDSEPKLLALNPYKQFIISHALHSYFASTMLLESGRQYRYVVNEGTFMMMNTFDLTVDHLIFEIQAMPWAVKNQLDYFADEYSYYDQLHFPEDQRVFPGGISFTHDQGVYHCFTPHGYSSYELSNQSGCYSYMSAEQLCNFIVCAGAYINKTNDLSWLCRRRSLLEDCLISMINRDHPDPAERNGINSLDSCRCGTESEITTYDSLDPSLGQARNNIYMASKCFAAYLILEMLFKKAGESALSAQAAAQARLSAKTISESFDPVSGSLPALIGEDNKTPIIPVAEGLVYLYICGLENKLSEFQQLSECYQKHFLTVMRKGICLFEDNGWKLSAGNINTWMSKIFLNQFVLKYILHIDISHCDEQSDQTHAAWWSDFCRESPCVDQLFAGKCDSSGFHYPRSVTSLIWLTI